MGWENESENNAHDEREEEGEEEEEKAKATAEVEYHHYLSQLLFYLFPADPIIIIFLVVVGVDGIVADVAARRLSSLQWRYFQRNREEERSRQTRKICTLLPEERQRGEH